MIAINNLLFNYVKNILLLHRLDKSRLQLAGCYLNHAFKPNISQSASTFPPQYLLIIQDYTDQILCFNLYQQDASHCKNSKKKIDKENGLQEGQMVQKRLTFIN